MKSKTLKRYSVRFTKPDKIMRTLDFEFRVNAPTIKNAIAAVQFQLGGCDPECLTAKVIEKMISL